MSKLDGVLRYVTSIVLSLASVGTVALVIRSDMPMEQKVVIAGGAVAILTQIASHMRPPPGAAGGAGTALGVLLALAAGSTGCDRPSTIANSARAAAYVAELEMCVESAKTLAESRLCRCEVNTRWQRPCTPAFVPDGGAQ